MKLSETMREGIKKYPNQEHLDYFGDGGIDGDSACALGSVSGICHPTIDEDEDLITDAIKKAYPELDKLIELPTRMDGIHTLSLFSAIVYLNDDKDWSREAIADWLESINY